MNFRGIHSIEELLKKAAINRELIIDEIKKVLVDFKTIVVDINLHLLNSQLPPRMNWEIEDLVKEKLLKIVIDSVKDEINKNPELSFEDIIELVSSQEGTDMFLSVLGNSFQHQLTSLISTYPQFKKQLNDLGKAYKDYTIKLKYDLKWDTIINQNIERIAEKV